MIRILWGFISGVSDRRMVLKRRSTIFSKQSRRIRILPLRSDERRVGKECRSLCDWSSDVCSSDLSDSVARSLALNLTADEQKQLRKHYTTNAAAYDSYLMGLYFWGQRSKDGLEKAINYFQQAVEKDSNFALEIGRASCRERV